MEPFCFELKSGSPYTLAWPKSSVHPEHIEAEAGNALRAFQASELQSTLSVIEEESQKKDGGVLIYPIIQAGQFGIREEEECLDLLFKHIDHHAISTGEKALVDFTSGYFSLSESYQKLIQRSFANYRVLCASPLVQFF